MTSEAAILGTPSFKCNTFAGKLSVPNEIEHKFELCFSFQPRQFDGLINELEKVLEDEFSKVKWKEKVDKMWQSKIDVSEFIFNYAIQF
jgi:hypothetical protein